MKHDLKEMIKDKKYKITNDKYVSSHRWRCQCSCPEIVTNLLAGSLTWTRIKFDCGEMIKINCQCLEEVDE